MRNLFDAERFRLPLPLTTGTISRHRPNPGAGTDIKLGVDLSVTVDAQAAKQLEGDLRQAIEDVGLGDTVRIEGQ